MERLFLDFMITHLLLLCGRMFQKNEFDLYMTSSDQVILDTVHSGISINPQSGYKVNRISRPLASSMSCSGILFLILKPLS